MCALFYGISSYKTRCAILYGTQYENGAGFHTIYAFLCGYGRKGIRHILHLVKNKKKQSNNNKYQK